MLKAVAPVLLVLGTLLATPTVAAADGFVIDKTCRRVSLVVGDPVGKPSVLVCPPGM